MDTCDPVGKKRPGENRGTIQAPLSGTLGTTLFNLTSEDSHPARQIKSAVLPVIIHVLNLPFDKAVDALAVRPVCETTDHPEPVGPLLSGKQLLNRNHDPLSPLLLAVDAHHFLFQTHLRLDQGAVFCLPPSSL